MRLSTRNAPTAVGGSTSRLAVKCAAQELFWLCQHEAAAPELLVQKAFAAAVENLQRAGERLGIHSLQAGLRSTLIVVVAVADAYYWGYIGDGAIQILHCDGRLENVLVPHRFAGGAANALAASLGPLPHGEPAFGNTPRRGGDLLLCGTDGVFDRVDGALSKQLLRLAIQYQGDLQRAIDQILHELSPLPRP